MGHEYHFNVEMSCSGCSGAIERVLKKLDGVENIDISLDEQSVKVKTSDSVTYDVVHEKISKTGKKIITGKTIM